MKIEDLDPATAEAIAEDLRTGVPSHRGTSLYSTGNEKFLANVRKRHLDPEPTTGKVRFVAGSWGAGKTHFFRLLTEQAFDAGYLVSTVELSAQETPFNKFELVLFGIVRNIAAPESVGGKGSIAPFGDVLRRCVEVEAGGADGDFPGAIARLSERLYKDSSIDVDVKKVVKAYWETFAAESQDPVVLEERRGVLLQWFAGEAHKTTFRREFDVQKVVSKENARTVLSSLVALIQLIGFKGLVVLFDESEMTHSTMSKSNLKQAHNNLLHLLNEVGETPGLLLVYAAVPEFFNDPKTGIVIYGALAARIGSPPETPPRALDKVWNLDQVETQPTDYADAAMKISEIYCRAYPEDADALVPEAELRERILAVVDQHGPYEATSRWRVVIKETTKLLDLTMEGEDLPEPTTSYRETLNLLDRLGDD